MLPALWKTIMKAISLWEPWATAMALGKKKNETRGWDTNYRGDLVICSAKRKMDDVGLDVCCNAGIDLTQIRYGYALCIVELYDVLPTAKTPRDYDEEALGDYSAGRFAWLTRNLRRIEPFPVIGRQGFFEVDLPK